MVRLAATSPEIFGRAFNIKSGKLHLVRYAIGWKVANELLGSKWKWKDHGNLPSVKKRQREGVQFCKQRKQRCSDLQTARLPSTQLQEHF